MASKKVKVAVKDLVVGLYIDLDLSWQDHPFTFSKFKIKDNSVIKTIQGLGLKEVTVLVEKSEVTVPAPSTGTAEVDAQSDQQQSVVEQKGDLAARTAEEKNRYLHKKKEQVARQFRQTASQIEQMTDDLRKRPVNAIENIDSIVMQMSSVFGGSQDMITQMVNLGKSDHSDFNHITNVTMLSLMIGKAEKMDAAQLTLLGTAALLHDAGKIKIPLNIIFKKSPLSDAEQKIYEKHTTSGRQFIEKLRPMNPEILNTIERHHEFLDGSGYPKGLQDYQLSKIVRIVTVTNLYDNLCNPADINMALSPKKALATLYKSYEHKVDRKLVERLIGLLGVYPPGTVVRLTDGALGLVISGDSGAYMNPSVLIYDPDIPKQDAKIICLAEYNDLNIQEEVSPGDFPPEIHEYLSLRERLGYMIEHTDEEE